MRGFNLFYLFGALVLVYLGLTFLLPPDPQALQRYDITSGKLRALNVTIAVPLAAIWASAFYGYIKSRSYSSLIKRSTEGRAVHAITNGLMILAIGLPVVTILTTTLRFVGRQDPSVVGTATVIINYLNLLIPLAAFVFISLGARKLVEIAKQRPTPVMMHLIIILFALLSVGYSYFVLHFAFSNTAGSAKAYAMPLWLVLLTLVVPYVYTWYIGLVAAYELLLYNSAVKGVLYRKSWSLLSAGLAFIVLAQIVIQYITTLNAQLTRLSLSGIMLLVYGLLLLMAVGYILVALGAKRLQKIEEV